MRSEAQHDDRSTRSTDAARCELICLSPPGRGSFQKESRLAVSDPSEERPGADWDTSKKGAEGKMKDVLASKDLRWSYGSHGQDAVLG